MGQVQALRPLHPTIRKGAGQKKPGITARGCLKNQAQYHPEIIKVFGEAFSKKLQKTPPF
ncbi:hypothetical protein [Novacetimonas hansenii]|uniref:hypothetical protein n=1 Tax=Novacetimonas hansenii TaxID=436 RepID=UPI0015E8A268|nr:hypothetical protein [Novacetimonas hansenii]